MTETPLKAPHGYDEGHMRMRLAGLLAMAQLKSTLVWALGLATRLVNQLQNLTCQHDSNGIPARLPGLPNYKGSI